MGSLRNPIGPLPSSIYWRRRAVALALLLLLVALVVWLFTGFGGDGDQRGQADGGADGKGGASSPITPGPSATESLPDNRPGGREEADGGADGGSSASGGAGGSASGSGDGSGGGDAGGSGSGGGSGDGSGGSDAGGSESADGGTGAGGGLPVCTSAVATLSLKSAENTYAPGERPELRITVDNGGAADCRVGVGPRQAILTITDAEDETVWSSEHCDSEGKAATMRVPAGQSVTHTVEWDRRGSAPDCPKGARDAAAPGTYLAEVDLPGLGTAQISFVLAKD
ncbi:hypothetical protein JJV70_19665 [Streptomyces sp. JJ66]|uniref:hypothetical protein n=1 Tax=Streptomyces sp. JJ66 TaxID=2803843 RepID=UPI001C56C9B8|nr:hypothetical protein [Streptomyces sp. JJ66]MBW1604280.1 hypothetical protein [Streptomyces sp. JJ66]